MTCARGKTGGDLRAGSGAGRRHHRALPRRLGLDLVPGTGLLAACIPGTFDTWMTLLRDYGTMRLADVLAPAIGYAQNGYPLVERISATIDTVKDMFRDHWPTSAAIYLPGGKVPTPGTLFTNPKLAETYERMLREAQSGAARARPRSSARARSGRRASSPKRSTSSAARRRSWTRRAERHRGVLTGRTWRLAGDRRGADLTTTTAATAC